MTYPIYLDYNATTPCDPRVIEKMLPYFGEHFGNASSKAHAYGWMAEEAVELARQQIADLLGAKSTEIIFTSGATESCNLAIRGFVQKNKHKGNHIITVSTEHKAVLDVCDNLSKNGFDITYLPVDQNGSINVSALENAITPQTILIAAMYVNNETGVIHPIKAIGAIAKKHGICFFTDATQAVGKMKIDVGEDDIDMLAFSAHKLYGPKGVGALYIKSQSPKIDLDPILFGGGHEKSLRSGTLNVPGIVGFGEAALIAKGMFKSDVEKFSVLAEIFLEGVSKIKGVSINGSSAERLNNVLNICFDIHGGEGLIKILSKNIAVSSGSACSSSIVHPSHVLTAMHLDRQRANSSIRFSFGRSTTAADIEIAIQSIHHALKN